MDQGRSAATGGAERRASGGIGAARRTGERRGRREWSRRKGNEGERLAGLTLIGAARGGDGVRGAGGRRGQTGAAWGGVRHGRSVVAASGLAWRGAHGVARAWCGRARAQQGNRSGGRRVRAWPWMLAARRRDVPRRGVPSKRGAGRSWAAAACAPRPGDDGV